MGFCSTSRSADTRGTHIEVALLAAEDYGRQARRARRRQRRVVAHGGGGAQHLVALAELSAAHVAHVARNGGQRGAHQRVRGVVAAAPVCAGARGPAALASPGAATAVARQSARGRGKRRRRNRRGRRSPDEAVSRIPARRSVASDKEGHGRPVVRLDDADAPLRGLAEAPHAARIARHKHDSLADDEPARTRRAGRRCWPAPAAPLAAGAAGARAKVPAVLRPADAAHQAGTVAVVAQRALRPAAARRCRRCLRSRRRRFRRSHSHTWTVRKARRDERLQGEEDARESVGHDAASVVAAPECCDVARGLRGAEARGALRASGCAHAAAGVVRVRAAVAAGRGRAVAAAARARKARGVASAAGEAAGVRNARGCHVGRGAARRAGPHEVRRAVP